MRRIGIDSFKIHVSYGVRERGILMESNQRYFARRAREELHAAARAITPEARARRRALAESFAIKAKMMLPEESRELILG
ncbi:MAG: hypothetical protein JO013_00840 [Alphaproteobacteria bacterium]|nr:hypothetical protein [Alphaproteobacteria bacterium]